jgi:hypothetical protein
MSDAETSHESESSTAPVPRFGATHALSPAPLGYGVLVVIVCGLIEARYLNRGISLLDEGWAMYAAMQLHMGGTLYSDIFWVFPPAHVFTAWLGYAIAPGGILFTRSLYGVWTVALCLSCFQLGRRIMPSRFALLGALLLAFAAPRTHTMQLLFGYRYLVLAMLALLAFHYRLRTGDSRWMLAAGVMAGIAVCFRLTPGFAVSVGIGFGVMLATRDWRRWFGDWARFGAGISIVVVPVLAWFSNSVGLSQFVQEVVVHPLEMLQALPLPTLFFPRHWDRILIGRAFLRFEFRLYSGLYFIYAAALLFTWLRCFRLGRPYPHAFLGSLVIFGAVFYIRSHGRADEAHLDSTIPPICILLAHASSTVFARLRSWPRLARLPWKHAATAFCGVVLCGWILLLTSDQKLINTYDGFERIDGLADAIYISPNEARMIARLTQTIASESQSDDVILDLSPSPYFYVLTQRRGPGHRDTVIPGTFYDADDEEAFVKRLEAAPPKLAIWPHEIFDDMQERSLSTVAPRLVDWVRRNYEPVMHQERFSLLKYVGSN